MAFLDEGPGLPSARTAGCFTRADGENRSLQDRQGYGLGGEFNERGGKSAGAPLAGLEKKRAEGRLPERHAEWARLSPRAPRRSGFSRHGGHPSRGQFPRSNMPKKLAEICGQRTTRRIPRTKPSTNATQVLSVMLRSIPLLDCRRGSTVQTARRSLASHHSGQSNPEPVAKTHHHTAPAPGPFPFLRCRSRAARSNLEQTRPRCRRRPRSEKRMPGKPNPAEPQLPPPPPPPPPIALASV